MDVEQQIKDAGYEDILVFNGPAYESAFLGVSNDNRAVYSYQRMVAYLMENDEMSEEEACEFIDFNTLGSIGFPGSPIIIFEI